jgi:hypothetical protein
MLQLYLQEVGVTQIIHPEELRMVFVPLHSPLAICPSFQKQTKGGKKQQVLRITDCQSVLAKAVTCPGFSTLLYTLLLPVSIPQKFHTSPWIREFSAHPMSTLFAFSFSLQDV